MTTSETSDFKVRGYMVTNAATYLRETVEKMSGADEAKRIMADLSPGVRATLAEAKAAGWYPVGQVSEIFRGVAGLARGNEQKAQELLVGAGAFNAREATNTFLKLLMRMLTPAIFAKKVPDFWRRDSTGGRLEVAIKDNRFTCHFYDFAGFDHAVVGTSGYLAFAFTAMGKTVTRTSIHGWSLNNPSADGAWMELDWADA